ncbi:MAG TPA: hypothetical protein VM370_00900 [Candidatus Thermoplasmatota archaeon]|nr:hypothetical protein [Candidatus Thermoplasmatota archaeon]
MQTWTSFRDVASTLLERRRAQRGFPTLGDDADRALVAGLASLPADAGALARETGALLGAQVFARRYHDDTLPRGVALLSEAMAASGLGALDVDHAFHRAARVRFRPSRDLDRAPEPVRAAFVEGVLLGFFSSTYNCEAHAARVAPDLVELTLGEGRDVNRRGQPA